MREYFTARIDTKDLDHARQLAQQLDLPVAHIVRDGLRLAIIKYEKIAKEAS